MKTGSSQPRSTALGPGLKRNSPERLLSLKRALPPGATAVTEAVSRTPGEIFGTNGEGTSIQDLSCAPRWAEGFSYRIPLKKKKKKKIFPCHPWAAWFLSLSYSLILFSLHGFLCPKCPSPASPYLSLQTPLKSHPLHEASLVPPLPPLLPPSQKSCHRIRIHAVP